MSNKTQSQLQLRELQNRNANRSYILITGLPGVGKTTLIRALAKRLAAYQPAGFFTEEIRDAQGAREGFRLVTLDGRQLVLAHVHHPGPSRVGRYGVDVTGFERLLENLDLRHAQSQLVIIDEIGKMECCSQRFTNDVTDLLSSPKMLIATIGMRGQGFISQVKNRSDCRLVTVTRENQDSLANELLRDVLDQLR